MVVVSILIGLILLIPQFMFSITLMALDPFWWVVALIILVVIALFVTGYVFYKLKDFIF